MDGPCFNHTHYRGHNDKKELSMPTIKKPWGIEEILETNKHYTVKRLTMNEGQQCSFQFHRVKLETVHVLSGVLCLRLNDRLRTMKPGDTATILPEELHRMSAPTGPVEYLECSTSQLDDVVRMDDDYGRK